MKLKNIQNDLVQKQSVEIKQTLENLRETMCLTSGLFKNNKMPVRKSAEKLGASKVHDISQEKKEKKFKIRVNSFHKVRMDESLYDP